MTRCKLTDIPCPCSIQKRQWQAQGLCRLHQLLCIYFMAVGLVFFVGPLTVGVGVSLTPLPAAGTLPRVRLPCPASIWGHLSCVTGPGFVMFSCHSWRPALFWKRRERRLGEGIWESRDEWRLGKLWLGYTVWGKNLFSTNKKEKTFKRSIYKKILILYLG